MVLRTQETVKVYYTVDSQMQEKADKFGVSSRKKYITLENNPFGMIAGVLFTGRAVMEAMSKTRVNFMRTYHQEMNEQWNEMYSYIKTVSDAIAYDTIVSAKGKLNGGEMFQSQYDVETNDVSFDDFFYDKEKHQIYRIEIK